jgi:hypothetical protein
MTEAPDVPALFLAGARTIVEAIANPAVEEAWDRPSVLEDQRVSGLAGHLARGGVWVVADYLHSGTPDGPVDFTSAGAYFAAFVSGARPEDHQAIRDRGAAVAATGRDAVLRSLREHLEALEPELATLPGDHLVAVTSGKVMGLHDYLTTRIVEQAVHLDDLARSVGREPWALPEEHLAVAVAVGVDIGRLRHGTPAVMRALYRRGFAEPTLPVL